MQSARQSVWKVRMVSAKPPRPSYYPACFVNGSRERNEVNSHFSGQAFADEYTIQRY